MRAAIAASKESLDFGQDRTIEQPLAKTSVRAGVMWSDQDGRNLSEVQDARRCPLRSLRAVSRNKYGSKLGNKPRIGENLALPALGKWTELTWIQREGGRTN